MRLRTQSALFTRIDGVVQNHKVPSRPVDRLEAVYQCRHCDAMHAAVHS
jgi:hypothetical protein